MSSNAKRDLIITSSLEFNTQFGVAPFWRALIMIWESPSIISFLIFNLMHRLIPSSTASSSAILLEAMSNDFDLLAIQLPDSSRIIHPIPALPGFPLEAPSKFNFFHPGGGGSHLHESLARSFFFL